MNQNYSTTEALVRRQQRIAAKKAEQRRLRYAARKSEVAARESARIEAAKDAEFARAQREARP